MNERTQHDEPGGTPNFEKLGEAGGEAINEAAGRGDLGGVIRATRTFEALSGLIEANKAASLLNSSNPYQNILGRSASVELYDGIAKSARYKIPSPVYRVSIPNPLAEIISGINRSIDWPGLFQGIPKFHLRLLPANLDEIDLDRIEEVCRVADEDGTSLAWAPHSEIILELLDAADLDERSRILEGRALDIIGDVEESLADVAHPEVAVFRGLLEEACWVGAQGRFSALQALASNVLDSTLNRKIAEYLNVSKLEARQHFAQCDIEDLDDATMGELRLLLIGGGVETAFRREPGDGSVWPSYNRNESAHRVGEVSTPAHAVRALLLAQALVRWWGAQLQAEEDREGGEDGE